MAIPRGVIVVLVTVLFIVELLLLAFVLPMWLVTRRAKSFTDPQTRHVDYDNPYPGAAMWTTMDDKR